MSMAFLGRGEKAGDVRKRDGQREILLEAASENFNLESRL